MNYRGLILGAIVLLISDFGVAQTVRKISGRATHLKSGQPAYRIEAQTSWLAHRMLRFSARYVDPMGRIRMTREAVHHPDGFVPDERIEHPLTGKLSQTTRLKTGVRLSFREKTGASMRSVVVHPWTLQKPLHSR